MINIKRGFFIGLIALIVSACSHSIKEVPLEPMAELELPTAIVTIFQKDGEENTKGF